MTQKTAFKVSGMKCHSCAKIIKYGLEEEAGIKNIDVDFDLAKAFLEFDPAEIDASKIKDLGYKVVAE